MRDPYDHGLHRLVLATALVLALVIFYYGARKGIRSLRSRRPRPGPVSEATRGPGTEPGGMPQPVAGQDIPGVSRTQDLPLSAPAFPAEAAPASRTR